MNKFLILIFFVALSVAGYIFQDRLFLLYQQIISTPAIEQPAIKEALQQIEKKISLPSPLRTKADAPQSVLTEKGTIAWTNRARINDGNLPPLAENAALHMAAVAKVDDMFERQYFEHISPVGRGPAELVKDAAYEYIAIGENLALGNFENDEVLVTAWMNSPGHRANILNADYTEIGVAARRGVFEGRMVWLAVQEFGRPLSACPAPNKDIEATINAADQALKALEARTETVRNEIDNTPRRKDSGHNEKVEAYNALVKEYNELVTATKELVVGYNMQIKIFNECIQ